MQSSSLVPVTSFRSNRDPHGVSGALSWIDLLPAFRKPRTATDKAALPGYSLATFDGDYRTEKNVLSVGAVSFDHDAGDVDPETAIAALDGDFAGVLFTTFSHTPDKPRFRVILPLSRAVTAEEYRRIWTHVASTVRARGIKIDEATKDPSRFWFDVAIRPDATFIYGELGGDLIDVDRVLATLPAQSPVSAPALVAALVPVSAPATVDRHGVAIEILGGAWPARGRHVTQHALAGALASEGHSESAALEVLCSVCKRAGDEDRTKRTATVRRAFERLARGESLTGWTTLATAIDPAIVDAARGLLKRDASEAAAFDLTYQSAPAASTQAPNQSNGSNDQRLGFEFGTWSTEPPPIEFLVKGLIPVGAVTMFFGRADSLKTWLAYSLVIALANGQPWLGYATKQARAGIIDYETGKANIRRRLYMLRAGANPNLGAVSFTSLKPNDKQFWRALEQEHFDLVVIDSLRRANPGANENDSGEAILPLELAAEFSEATGCAVLWIHHAKKASQDGWPEFRGSAAIEDQVDSAFAVRKTDVTPTRKHVEVRCEKPGDMTTPAPFAAEVTFDDDARRAIVAIASEDAQAPAKASEIEPGDIRAAIRLALASGPISTKEKLRSATGGRRDEVYAEIGALVAEEEIVYIQPGGYRLDSDAARQERVLACLRSGERFKTAARLANAAYVATRFVESLERRNVVCGSDVGRLMEVSRAE